MDNNQIRELIKNLQISMRCPKCGKKYNLDEIFLKSYVGNTYFLQLNCSNCRTSVYASISVTGNLQNILKNIEKRQKHKNIVSQNIQANDIIDMHQFLEDFDGDFQSILKES